jgi:hypothetical protein
MESPALVEAQCVDVVVRRGDPDPATVKPPGETNQFVQQQRPMPAHWVAQCRVRTSASAPTTSYVNTPRICSPAEPEALADLLVRDARLRVDCLTGPVSRHGEGVLEIF